MVFYNKKSLQKIDNIMKYRLLLLVCINIFLTIKTYGMKRRREVKALVTTSHKKQKRITSLLLSLPEDMQKIIIYFTTNNSTASTPKLAARTINALAKTNKKFNTLINDEQFSDQLIEDNARKYNCSHETIAKFLHTKSALKRLNIQRKLKKLCYNADNPYDQQTKLDQLIEEGINLDFIYNHKNSQKTALMITAKENVPFFNYLIEKNSNPNTSNSSGMTALHVATEFPIDTIVLMKLLNHPGIIIDQPNKSGATPLLNSLINRKQFHFTPVFYNAIQELIAKDADPEYANKKKITPINVAKELDYPGLVTIIEKAIEKKQNHKS